MELLLLQIALEHRDQSCLSAGSPLRRVNLIISISLSFVALMYSALRILYWRLLWRRILHGNDSAHLSSTLPPVRRSAHPHTHTHTQFFPSLAKSCEQQKKASGVRSRHNSAGYILLETCCLYVSTIVVQRCNIFQRPYANTFRQASKNGLRRVRTQWRYFKVSRGEKTNSSGHFKVEKNPSSRELCQVVALSPLLACTVSLDGGCVISARLL